MDPSDHQELWHSEPGDPSDFPSSMADYEADDLLQRKLEKHSRSPAASLKRCPHCRVSMPNTPENFHSNKRSKDGLQTWCRKCIKLYNKERYHIRKKIRKQNEEIIRMKLTPTSPEHAQHIIESGYVPTGYKRCNVCGQVLPLSCYHKRTQSPDRHSYTCKPCANAKSRKYNQVLLKPSEIHLDPDWDLPVL